MKIFRYYALIIAISLLPLISLFTSQDLIHTHDGLVHLPRIAAYFKALTDGQIPVRWAGDLNFGYGMPLFNFIYPLPYVISSAFLFLGAGLVTSFKLALSLSFLLSGVFMLAFTRALFNDNQKAFLVTLFYQFAPFRLVELLVRGSFGEVYTYAFLPLVLLGITLLFKKPRYKLFLLTAIATALLVLSHNSVSLLFFAVSVLFVLYFAKQKKQVMVSGLALIAGLLLTSFYWLPAIIEHKFTYGDLFMRNLYLEHFSPLQNFFIPNIFNNEALQIGGISVQIGIFHSFAILLALMRLRRDTKLMSFCLLLIITSLFFTQPISKIFWENISFLRQFQFPWRLLSVIVFGTSLLSVSFLSFSFFKKKVGYALLLSFVVLSTAYFWHPREEVDTIDEGYYWNFPLNTTYYGETDVIWSAGPASSYPVDRVEVISGEGLINDFSKKSNLQTFTINAGSDVSIASRTQYFPGWRAYVDEKEVPIQFQDPNWRGLLTFSVAAGEHNVRIAFGETRVRLAADIISGGTLLILVFLAVLNRKNIL